VTSLLTLTELLVIGKVCIGLNIDSIHYYSAMGGLGTCQVTKIKVRGVFCLRNVNIVGFYYLFNMPHVSVIRPSSSRNIFARTYSTDDGSVVFRILLNIMNNYSERFD
jgi:hypothetical protein